MISVIVPVYNPGKYLGQCIESVLAQEVDLELILVDDGSTDGSSAACDAWAEKDPRIKVIHKSNAGVSAARNDGIEAARGEFIAFCDDDDFLAPGMFSRLIEVATGNDCDIVQCRAAKGSANTLPAPVPRPVHLTTGRAVLENFYNRASIYIWDKLYRRRVWREIRFPVGSFTDEDQWVAHHLFGAANRVALLDEIFYYHRIHHASVMNRGFDTRWATAAFDDRLDFALRLNLPALYSQTLARRLFRERYFLVMNRRYTRDGEFHRQHKRLLKQYYKDALPHLSLKDRLFCFACRHIPILYHLYNYLKWHKSGLRFGEIK